MPTGPHFDHLIPTDLLYDCENIVMSFSPSHLDSLKRGQLVMENYKMMRITGSEDNHKHDTLQRIQISSVTHNISRTTCQCIIYLFEYQTCASLYLPRSLSHYHYLKVKG